MKQKLNNYKRQFTAYIKGYKAEENEGWGVHELNAKTLFENATGLDIWALVDCAPDSVPAGQDECGISHDLLWAEELLEAWFWDVQGRWGV